MKYCTHHECRCAAAVDLSYMHDVTGRNDILAAAVAVHHKEVRCRHVPRDGRTPLPPRKESDGQGLTSS